jgi:hypothetical protein
MGIGIRSELSSRRFNAEVMIGAFEIWNNRYLSELKCFLESSRITMGLDGRRRWLVE